MRLLLDCFKGPFHRTISPSKHSWTLELLLGWANPLSLAYCLLKYVPWSSEEHIQNFTDSSLSITWYLRDAVLSKMLDFISPVPLNLKIGKKKRVKITYQSGSYILQFTVYNINFQIYYFMCCSLIAFEESLSAPLCRYLNWALMRIRPLLNTIQVVKGRVKFSSSDPAPHHCWYHSWNSAWWSVSELGLGDQHLTIFLAMEILKLTPKSELLILNCQALLNASTCVLFLWITGLFSETIRQISGNSTFERTRWPVLWSNSFLSSRILRMYTCWKKAIRVSSSRVYF